MIESPARTAIDLLLACARTGFDEAWRARAEALIGAGPDWGQFLKAVVWHRVASLVHRSLGALSPDPLPVTVREALDARVTNQAARNDLLTWELLRLLDLFERAGVESLPLKGPVLATLAYGSRHLRWSGDLDLVVRTKDYDAARLVLLSHGYDERAAFLRHDGTVAVDLQHRGFFADPLDPEPPWQRLVRVDLAGRPVSSLAPEDLLIYLCAHGAKHCWDRLGWLTDIAELCRRQPMDWAVVAARCREARASRVVRVALDLAQGLLGAVELEAPAAQLGADPVAGRLAAEIRHQVRSAPGARASALARPIFRARVRESFSDKAAYAVYYAKIWTLKPVTTLKLWRGEQARRMSG